MLALLGAFVPYIGRALTALLIFTVALASVGPLPAIALFVVFVLGSIAIDRALAQMATGRRLELHPILAVVGLPIGLALAGFGGLVVILPLLAFAQTTAGVLTTALGREPVAAPAPDPAPRPHLRGIDWSRSGSTVWGNGAGARSWSPPCSPS